MASMGTLVFTTMLFFVLCGMSIRRQGLSQNLILENNFKLGFVGSPQPNNSLGDSSRRSSIKEAQTSYIHFAGYQSTGAIGGTPWHGVRADINVWEIPDVRPRSSSGAHIAAISQASGLEAISAGVHVYPSLYHDDKLHFFTYWTSAGGNLDGCYNTYCTGFVTANGSNLFPGQVLAPPLSIYGGQQRGITISIKKDEHTGDWSLYREDQGGPIGGVTLLGWWPSSLFKSLSKHAEIIRWTGFVNYSDTERSPSMGSGHSSSEHEGKAAAFNDCFGFDKKDVYVDDYHPVPVEDKPDCYNVSPWYDTSHAARRHFFYGGPGGCSG